MKSVSWLPMPEAATDDVFTVDQFNVLKNNVKFLEELSEVEHSSGVHDPAKMGGKGSIIWGGYSPGITVDFWNSTGWTLPASLGTGKYRILFTPTLSSALYAVSVRCTQPYRGVVLSRATTYCEVAVLDTSNNYYTLTGTERVSVAIWQRA